MSHKKPSYKGVPSREVLVKTLPFKNLSQEESFSNPLTWTDTEVSFSSHQFSHDARVAQLLEELGLQEYLEAFEANQITMEDLQLLTKEDLCELGLPIGPRNRILRATGKLAVPKFNRSQANQEVSAFLKEVDNIRYRKAQTSRRVKLTDLSSFLNEISQKQQRIMNQIHKNKSTIKNLSKSHSQASLRRTVSPSKFASSIRKALYNISKTPAK